MNVGQYCRELETYLCRKNEGHLIRIVGPVFDQVSAWAQQGVPLTIAFRGVDRYCERYYAKGPRRRPVRIEFCEADILDLCLDLSYQEDVPAGSEAEHIDPAVTPPVDDFDLAPDLPARRRQAARHIGDAGSMSGLSLAKTIRKEGGVDAK